MSAVPPGKFERNATVQRVRTAFWATGRRDQAGSVITEVAAALGNLPTDRLARERGVLEAEYGQVMAGPLEVLLAVRYGNHGLGLMVYPGLGSQASEAVAVRAHAERWFVRSNAILTVAGAMPEGLRLELPDRPMPQREVVDLVQGPIWTPVDGDPGLSIVLPDAAEAALGARLMSMRLERVLREERGLIYGVLGEAVRLDATGQVVFQLTASTTPDAATEVAQAIAAEFLDRLENGVTQEEIDEDDEWFEALRESEDYVDWLLERAADYALAGRPHPEVVEPTRPAAESSPALMAMLRENLHSALLMAPEGTEVPQPFTRDSGCAVTTTMTVPELRRRMRSGLPKGAALGFDGSAVQYRDHDGDVHEVRFDECVGVGVGAGTDEGGRLLFGRRGCHVWVHPKEFRGADALVRAVDERFPAELRFTLD